MTTAAAARSGEAAGSLQPTLAHSPDASPIPRVENTRLFPQHKVQSNRKEKNKNKTKLGPSLSKKPALRRVPKRAQRHQRSGAAGLEDGGTAPRGRPGSSKPSPGPGLSLLPLRHVPAQWGERSPLCLLGDQSHTSHGGKKLGPPLPPPPYQCDP